MTRSFNTQDAKTTAILEMLSWRRPAGSKTERAFIREYIEPVGVYRDAFGNLLKKIGEAPILWSAHTDTVHRIGGRQTVSYSKGKATTASKGSNCLGADDTAGIWLLLEMIRADVPGLYVFHREEELGGLGSRYIADNTPEIAAGISAAIAFDRKGQDEIITHQGTRTASDAFARSLGAAFGMAHAPSDRGTFTDTASYTDLIGECTNVSVGYTGAHTANEAQDIPYLLRLRDAVIGADLSKLAFARAPGKIDESDDWWNRGGMARGWYGDDDTNAEAPNFKTQAATAAIVHAHSYEIADWLEEHGITAGALLEIAYNRGAVIRERY